MRRRGDDAVDPLDLLLDTVCNLLAVLIFIAVLAAIMVEPVRDDAPDTAPAIVPEAVAPSPRVVRFEIDDPSLAEADLAIVDLQAELERQRASIDLLEELDRRFQESTGDLAELESSLESDAAALSARLEDRSAATQVPMRTPRRDSQRDAIPVAIYLWRDQVFLAHDFRGWAADDDPSEAWLRYMGEERLDPRVVRRDRSSIRDTPNGERRYRIHLREDGGIAAGSPAALRGDPRWRDAIAGLIPGRHIVYLSVRQDAFTAFGAVRSELARAGLGYDVFIEPGEDGRFETVWVTGLPTTQ